MWIHAVLTMFILFHKTRISSIIILSEITLRLLPAPSLAEQELTAKRRRGRRLEQGNKEE
jgi:hypothetical protein